MGFIKNLIFGGDKTSRMNGGKVVATPNASDVLFGRGKYMQEFKAGRRKISKQYMIDRRVAREQLRREEKKMKHSMKLKKKEIYRYYRVTGTEDSLDSKKMKALKKAKDRYSLYEKQTLRGFRRQKMSKLNQLKRQRDGQIKQMRVSLREPRN